MVASIEGHKEVVEALLEAGADVTASGNVRFCFFLGCYWVFSPGYFDS